MTEIHISVDIEADGLYPGDYSMSSFGAVACVVRGRDWVNELNMSHASNRFYAELKPISDKFDPEAAAVAGFNRRDLIQNGEDPATAMKRFNAWVTRLCQFRGEPVRAVFIGWPVSYDWLWLYWYLMKFTGTSPFGHSTAIDMKTWYAALTFTELSRVGKRNVKKEIGIVNGVPHTHNALDDAIEQGELWQKLVVWKPNEL